MMATADLLDIAADVDEDEEEQYSTIVRFTAEQLRLAVQPPRGRRYNSALMTKAMVWERTSPKLYEELRNSGMICLPSKAVIRRLTSALSVAAGLDDGTMTYLKMRINKLSLRERLVNLALDEVYSAQGVELAAGKVTGMFFSIKKFTYENRLRNNARVMHVHVFLNRFCNLLYT